jgi:hypothetical protein
MLDMKGGSELLRVLKSLQRPTYQRKAKVIRIVVREK